MTDLPRMKELLLEEITQRTEEGCATAGFAERAGGARDSAAAQALWDDLQALVPAAGWVEPSGLDEIRLVRPAGPRRMAPVISAEVLRDKTLGGWLGRIAGCQLGKPVEGWPHDRIAADLKAKGRYPLDDYLAPLTFALRDDDQDYTILGLHLLEKHGAGFTSGQVADAWLEMFPYHQVYTAERETYRNLIAGIRPPESAVPWNPYREWIGAQIRADGWGFCSPCRPEQAAAFGFRDAAVSHVKNGIYGEMFFAAAIAAAFASDSLDEVLDVALSEIPARSRFAAMVADCRGWAKSAPDFEAAWQLCAAKYGRYHWVHTLNNAAVVVLALLFGRKDFGKTISLAVSGGWDTDCNGATAGAVLGVMLGERAIPRRWTSVFNDRIQSALFGYGESRITALADRMVLAGAKVSGG